MKQTVIGILPLPPIVENGIVNAIAKMRHLNCSVHRLDPARIKEQIQHYMPAVIIADPVGIDCSVLTQIRSLSAIPPKLMGIQICALPAHLASTFDSLVSVYDTIPLFESALEKLTADLGNNDDEESKSLSQREKDVVIGIARGLSNKEIASSMNVSVNTVMTHRRNISAKLKIHSPAGITIFAIVSKLIKLEDVQTQLQ